MVLESREEGRKHDTKEGRTDEKYKRKEISRKPEK